MLGAELKDQGVAYVIVNEAGRQRLLDEPVGPRGIPRIRCHAPRRRFHRAAAAGSAQRTGQDRAGQHRRGAVSARRQGQAPRSLAGRSRRVVRELRRRRREHGQPRALALRVRAQSTHGPAGLRISPRARSLPQPRAASRGARLRRCHVRAGGRVPQDRGRRKSAGCHVDPPGKLCDCHAGAGTVRRQACRSDRERSGRGLGPADGGG